VRIARQGMPHAWPGRYPFSIHGEHPQTSTAPESIAGKFTYIFI
jgi:hypothetical protein